ncbi:MAG: sigma-54-dependent Fis family transcriptional regulator [Deltaproteobacteria bacterium]|nr:sigma-54-dependent Fis family transcriptional regulator [Deltaproteobacteria bacterium]
MATILIVDDDASLREVLEIALFRRGHKVWSAADCTGAKSLLASKSPDLTLLDLRLGQESGLTLLQEIREKWPDLPVIMITAYAETQSAITAMKCGARDYIGKPFDLDDLMLTVDRNLEASRLRQENRWLRDRITDRFGTIVGTSPVMKTVFTLIDKIAPTDINVLVTGESGTGKELVARALHGRSHRRDKPFLPINCGGLPENLIESELFGYRKGAFTGADKAKKGLFEIADQGTLFLDEVGDLHPSLQVKLLRCIQDKSFIPLGATEEVKSDVRIVGATNRPVDEDVASGLLREDLYYRLSGVIIHIPPLRDRREDIPALADHFLTRACRSQNKSTSGFTDEARSKLQRYDYPGNVRELENIVERAVALENAQLIQPESLVVYEQAVPPHGGGEEAVLDGRLSLDEFLVEREKRILQEALRRTGGHKGNAAELVGLNLRQFRYRLVKVGLD